jgi:hypothetical protein
MITGDPQLSPAQAVAALQDALDIVINSLDRDVLAGVGDDQLLGFARDFETVRNRMSVVDQEIVTACDATTLARRLAQCGTAKLLVDTLHIDHGEAQRRVRATEALHADTSMLGQRLQPQRPVLAAAVAAGTIPAGNADRAIQCLQTLQRLPWTTPEDISTAEELVTDAAQKLTPAELRLFIAELADRINPDGTFSEERVHAAQRGIQLWHSRDGSWHLQGRLTPALAHKIKAVTDPLSQPQSTDDEPDLRTTGQRLHDAFEEVFDRLLQSDDNPSVGGTPATVVVTIGYEQLLHRTGHGHYADSTPVSPQQVLDLAVEAEIIPTVLAANGKVLWLGRSRRIADKNQTAALTARDGGCSFPGCDRPPQWCQRHHIRSWAAGGSTDIGNLTYLCLFHHARFEELGWHCRMTNGLPYWIPPRWIDPDQQPKINYRIQLRHLCSSESVLPCRSSIPS